MNRRVASSFAAIALAAGVLTGCAVSPPSLSPEASSDLQARVVAVAESAAAGDAATALAGLDELEQTVDAALAAGQVTAARAAEIQAALDVVRADLQEPVATPTPTPTVDPAPVETVAPGVGDGGNGDGGNDDGGGGNGDGGGDDSGGEDGGQDNSGPGNNNGDNGKGNGNGKGKGNDD